MLKRAIDLFISLFLLCIGSPIIVVTIVLSLCFQGRPIFFKQKRPGLEEKPFFIYKLRTMIDKYDERGVMCQDYLRFTRWGLFLRKYSLDEWPQFINVLKGEMSLVGPRPLLMSYLPLYTGEEKRRHSVKPGITGLAQIKGRNHLSWRKKCALDIWYVEEQSFFLDMKILMLTIFKVLKKEGMTEQNMLEEETPPQSGDMS